MSAPETVEELIDLGERVLSDSTHLFEDHQFRADAEELLAHTLRIDVDDLDDEYVPPLRLRERYLSLIARRAGGEPFPLLVGYMDFYGLELKVRPGAFFPRPSSELTVDRAVHKLRRRSHPTVVDVCTGAGPIALAIASEVSESRVWGVDIAEEGLDQGRENARRLGIKNVRFRRGDMYDPLPRKLHGKVDLITGHVPYVPVGEVDDLPSEVVEHEPLHTLTDSSVDGMRLMRRAIHEGRDLLKAGGWLLLEVAEDIAPKTEQEARGAGYSYVKPVSDDDGLSVVIEARQNR